MFHAKHSATTRSVLWGWLCACKKSHQQVRGLRLSDMTQSDWALLMCLYTSVLERDKRHYLKDSVQEPNAMPVKEKGTAR